MLWIEKYRPVTLDQVVGQETAVSRLRSFVAVKNLSHLMVTGPAGTGKTAALECTARGLYGDSWEENTTMIPTGDLFSQGRSALEADERFSHLYRKDWSLLANFKYIVRWYASLQPLDAAFKMMVFEGADRLPLEVQAALRRTMERYSGTCRFAFCTSRPGALIPALTSRCYPLFFLPIADDTVAGALVGILEKEGVGEGQISRDDVDLVVHAGRGDLRRATMLLQVLVESGRGTPVAEITQSEPAAIVAQAFQFIREHDGPSALRTIESLMVDYGLSGREVLGELRKVVKREYNDPRIARMLADADYRLGRCESEFIQVNTLVTRIMQEVFP
ncbi:MAG: replication protein C [Methanomicrobiales archaeon]|nr:replication protein C [Methanomicrobiales archaeon]